MTKFKVEYQDSMDVNNALDGLVKALHEEGVDVHLEWDPEPHDGFDLVTVTVVSSRQR
jgi:hypothetical protein